ncbi:MAG: hypothetical protein IPJ69_04670 [Deltaproteobacteria bacterium]|nr:MAG: hypothetical protein IPJ69_04670 [Deltaproteobacteria bacterium]
MNMLQLYGKPCDVQSNRLDGVTVVTVKWLDLSATFTCLGSLSSEIKIRVFGNKGYKDLIFKNTFSAFKRTLEKFITSVKLKSEITTKNELVSAVSILQRGLL